MAGLDDFFKGNVVAGFAVGIGVAVLAPLLAPVLASVGRPLAKSAIKAGIIVYQKGLETAAELGEVLEDLVAESKAELAASAVQPSTAVQTVQQGSTAASAPPGP